MTNATNYHWQALFFNGEVFLLYLQLTLEKCFEIDYFHAHTYTEKVYEEKFPISISLLSYAPVVGACGIVEFDCTDMRTAKGVVL